MILLTVPPSTYYSGSENPRIQIPVGILYIATCLIHNHHEVEVYDAKSSGKLVKRNNILYFGDSEEEIAKAIKNKDPNIVGITSPFSSQLLNVLRFAEIVKKVNKNVLVVVGGASAAVDFENILKDPNVDIVVIGEGEDAMVEIANKKNKGECLDDIGGIAFRKNGKIINTKISSYIKNLDQYDFPAYHLIDMERYFFLQNKSYSVVTKELGKRSIPIVTSRGCPYSCSFCSVGLSMGNTWRANSAEYVLNHLEHVIKKYSVDMVHFSDDNIGLNPLRFEKILDGIMDRKFNIKWDTPNGVFCELLNSHILLKAKKSGCSSLHIGVESGVQHVLSTIVKKRGLRLEKVIEVAKNCHEIGLDLQAFYVVGMPGETIADIRATCSFAAHLYRKYFVYPHISVATPLPGTEMARVAEEKGYLVKKITPEALSVAKQFFGEGLIRTPEFSKEDIDNEIKKLRKSMIITFLIKTLIKPLSSINDIKAIAKKPAYLFRKFLLGS